jgi:hypothetical protein
VSVFSKLGRSSLQALATALETERITSGNPLSLQQYLAADLCAEIGNEIDVLIQAGMPPRHIASIVRAVLDERDANSTVRSTIELVWTGPGGTSSASRDTGVVVRELFMTARRTILIAGFAIHRGREIFKELADRMTAEPNLEVTMFLNIPRAFRDTTLTEQLVGRFAREFRSQHWAGPGVPTIFYDPRALAIDEKKRSSLHAKCVVVDGITSFVTSANFTEAAQVRNIEAGALIRDEQFSRSLIGHFEQLIRIGAVDRLPLG